MEFGDAGTGERWVARGGEAKTGFNQWGVCGPRLSSHGSRADGLAGRGGGTWGGGVSTPVV